VLRVLKSYTAITEARRQLERQGLSCLSPGPVRFARRLGRKLGLTRSVSVGDKLKSWDVLTTLEFIRRYVPPDSAVLDIGAFASEILCVLKRLGYTRLTGVDLDPRLTQMPYSDAIRYEVADFRHTPFEARAFQAITAISVIEHGFRSQALLQEIARLLRPDGYFLASFDYWPEKIDTRAIRVFDMEWTIFSRADVISFLDEARGYGLQPVGDLELDVATPAITWGGKHYTFAWLALQKRA